MNTINENETVRAEYWITAEGVWYAVRGGPRQWGGQTLADARQQVDDRFGRYGLEQVHNQMRGSTTLQRVAVWNGERLETRGKH